MSTTFHESVRFYKTGDHVLIDADGVVHFLGRLDRQVKVNGYRVELEHVESLLRDVEGVGEAAVFFLEHCGKQRLVAAVAPSGASLPANEEIARRLGLNAADYMVPRIYVPFASFPRNENGKSDLKAVREEVVQHLATRASAAREPTSLPSDQAVQVGTDSLRELVSALWSKHVHAAQSGDDQNFFHLGGDSLEAIQLIAELQLRGFDVTAHAFLRDPTIRGLLHALETPSHQEPVKADDQDLRRELSPAQSFFFREQLADADHNNQALLFETEERLDLGHLRAACRALMSAHPALRTVYGEHGEAPQDRELDEHDGEPLLTMVGPLRREDDIQAAIDDVADELQGSLSLRRGNLFKVHVIRRANGPDQLLLVAHHVAVDVISWRVLVSDLVQGYCDARAGRVVRLPRSRTGFHAWVSHLRRAQPRLEQESGAWLVEAKAELARRASRVDARNTEGAARTIWLSFTREQTHALQERLACKLDVPMHAALLGVFAAHHGRHRGLRDVWIDVESHGRLVVDESIDVSRSVGWHTSTYPVKLGVAPAHSAAVGALAALTRAAHLGVAFGLSELAAHGDDARSVSDVCYNYLGELHYPRDERLPLRPSAYHPGRARGGRNVRHHELKLTARIAAGQLVVDLSVPGYADLERYEVLLSEVHRDLVSLAEVSADGAELAVETGTRTGLLTYVPPRLLQRHVGEATRAYRGVLLTGATGFVGAHVLRELLVQSNAHVFCLVRKRSGRSAAERLRESLKAYFPHDLLESHAGRCTVLDGDITAECFGLTRPMWRELTERVQAIYHFAAETRLFGQHEDFVRANVTPVERVLGLATQGIPKDVHYMSTLAVAGVHPGPERIDYTEACFDVGQEFQNHYESTKHRAELLVKAAEAAGVRTFIYRSGNVSGDSVHARFQSNARDNRLIQFLVACVRLAKLPRELGEPVVLSPVDQVAAGIVAISLDASTPGGVFHVDSTYELPMRKLFDALEANGFSFESSERENFAQLFASTTDRAAEIAVGHFWALRRPRNVRFVSDRTAHVLERLGRRFSPITDEWLSRFARRLIADGAFQGKSSDRTATDKAATVTEQVL